MKKWKRISSLLVVSALGLSMLAGCGGGGSPDPAPETQDNAPADASDSPADAQVAEAPPASGGKNITVILMALNSDYWHMVEAGAKKAGAELGYTVNVIGPNEESDAIGQMNMIEDAVANQVDAIVVAATEPKAVLPSIQKAKDAGIPIITIDAKLQTDDDSLYQSFIGTGNYDASKLGGEYIASKLQPGDKIAIIRGLVGQPTHDERTNGFKDAVEAAGMTVVDVQPADSDRGKAVNVAENILQNHPDLKCFYATNDEMALGAYKALEGLQKTDILTMGFDGSFGAMDSIADGKLTSSIAQMPIEEGYTGVKTAIDILEGKEVEKSITIDVKILDKDNVAAFRADIDAEMGN